MGSQYLLFSPFLVHLFTDVERRWLQCSKSLRWTLSNEDVMEATFLLNNNTIIAPTEPLFLIDFLRRQHHLTGCKAPCREGDCGSCQLLILSTDYGIQRLQTQLSCLLKTTDIIHKHILTVEALPMDSPLIKVLAESGASQCGFCSPGLVMAMVNWLLNGQTLEESEGLECINGNLCRCTGYMGQRRAIQALSEVYQSQLVSRGLKARVELLVSESILPTWLSLGDEHLSSQQEDYVESVSAVKIAGGTDVYLEKGDGAALFRRIPMGGAETVRLESGSLFLNARHPVEWIARSLAEQQLFPAFQRWNHLFASLPIRSQATLGGNIAHASPIADGICFLKSLDAMIQTSQRSLSIHDFFLGMKKNKLNEGEIVEWVVVPQQSLNAFVHYDKVGRRQTTDIAAVNCSGVWWFTDDCIERVNIALGGASAMPVRLNEIENQFKGLSCLTSSSEIAKMIGPLIEGVISPISDLRGSANYRRLLCHQMILSQWLAVQNHYKESLLDV